jgi:hypothetical protein
MACRLFWSPSSGEIIAMPDPETATLLRSVLDELYTQVHHYDGHTKVDLASKLLEAVKQGRSSADELREAGRQVLGQAPTMWR